MLETQEWFDFWKREKALEKPEVKNMKTFENLFKELEHEKVVSIESNHILI